MSSSLSVFLITKNEAHNLPSCLEGIRSLADEIIVLDSGSDDTTCEIAENFGARVEVRPFDGFGQQKSYAESLCTHDWVLNLDADERVPFETCEEIRTFLTSCLHERVDGVKVRVVSVYPHQVTPRPFADYKNHIRLYNRKSLQFSCHPSHDVVRYDPALHYIHQLKNPVLHYSFRSLEDLEEKKKRRTRFYFETEKTGPFWKNLLRYPFEYPFTFFKSYILRRQITGGVYGLRMACLQAKYRRLRIAQRLRGKCLVEEDS